MSIELQLNAFCGDGLHLDIVLTNHALAPADITLTLDLMTDFADFNEALAGKRQQTGLVAREWKPAAGGGALSLHYRIAPQREPPR